MDLSILLLLLCGGALLAALSLKVLSSPLKLLGRVLLNTLLGLGALLLVDTITPLTGVHLGLNLVNGLVVGVLGLPGLGLLLLLQWVF